MVQQATGYSQDEVLFFNSLDGRAALFDTLPDSDQEHDILQPLLGKLFMFPVVVLKGSNGSGKTTAALMLARHCVNATRTMKTPQNVIWMDEDEVSFFAPPVLQQGSCIFIDDFLGKSTAESFDRWKKFIHFCQYNKNARCRYFLTTRTSILNYLIEHTGFKHSQQFLNVVTASMDRKKLWKSTKTTTKMKLPLESEPSCGFPLCCHLIPHVPEDDQRILFQRPMFALRRAVRKMMDSNDTARSALTLLALSEDGLDTNALLDTRKATALQKLLQNLKVQRQTLTDIVSYYQNRRDFIQVQDHVASFTNEVVRDAVLVVLSQCQARLLSINCSVKLQSQLALATSDDCEHSEDEEKPNLPDSVLTGFVQSVMNEIESQNYQLAFSSALFQHRSFNQMLESKMIEDNLLENCLDTSGREGLHFIFHAGAVDFIWKHSLRVLNEADHWVVLQALLACCYWGHDQDIPRLLQVFKKKKKLKKLLKDATVQAIVTGNLLGMSMKTELDWKMMPMYPKDTLLTMAAWRGNDAVVKLLVKRGMAVNSQGMGCSTALVHYCARGNIAMVHFLLQNNADASLSDVFDASPLFHALFREEWDIPEELFTESNVKLVTTSGTSTLMAACRMGWKVQIIEKLIDCGVNVTLKDKSDWTCLDHACQNGCTDIVSFLLNRHYINVSQLTENGMMSLNLAVMSPSRSDLIKILFKSVIHKSAIAESVVRKACLFADKYVLIELLTHIRAKDQMHKVAMQAACEFGNVDIVRHLKLHLDVEPKCVRVDDGQTCLHLAVSGNNVECIRFLIRSISSNSRTLNLETPLMFALRNGRVDFARELRSKEARTDAVDSNGDGCLHYAAQSHSLRALQWCVEEEHVDINGRNIRGKTALHTAVETTDARLVQYLLDKGADIKAADINGETALRLAARLGVTNVLYVLLTRQR